MLGLGWGEILLIGIVALVFIGPKQLPEVFRNIARLKNFLQDARDQWTSAIRNDESLQEIQRSINEAQKDLDRERKNLDQSFQIKEDVVKRLKEKLDAIPENHNLPDDEPTEVIDNGKPKS